MKRGLFCYPLAAEGGWSSAAVIDLARETGCQGIDWTPDLLAAEPAAIAAATRNAGLSTCCLTAFCTALRDSDTRSAGAERWRAHCRAAQALGSSLIMLPTPGDGSAPADCRKRWCEGLRTAVTIAAEYGLRVVIEPFPGPDSPFQHSADLLAACTAAPGLGIAFDSANGVPAENPLTACRACLPHIAHVHLKDDRVLPDPPAAAPRQRDGQVHDNPPLGVGTVDLPGVLAILRAADYRGFIVPEHNTPDRPAAERTRAGCAWLQAALADSSGHVVAEADRGGRS